MGAEQSKDPKANFLRDIGAIFYFDGVLPTVELVLLRTLNDNHITPETLYLNYADYDQKETLKKMHYCKSKKLWLNSRSRDYENELLYQTACIAKLAGCDVWLALFAFVLNRYDVADAIKFCRDDANKNVLDMMIDEDSLESFEPQPTNNWFIVHTKLNELLNDLPRYKPPANLVLPEAHSDMIEYDSLFDIVKR
jgi:hypothetical protein